MGRLNSFLLKEISFSSCELNSLLIIVFEFCLSFDVEFKIMIKMINNQKSDEAGRDNRIRAREGEGEGCTISHVREDQ